METVTVMLYGVGATVPDPIVQVEHELLVTVEHRRDRAARPECYDFRFSAPVSDQCICELEQLVSTLIQTTVARTVGLQPALF